MKERKGILIASLNSHKYMALVGDKNEIFISNDSTPMDIVVFENFEILNRVLLYKEDLSKASNQIEVKKKLFLKGIKKVKTIKIEVCINYEKQQFKLSEYIDKVFEHYHFNKSFRNHVHNQVYRNLHPKLKRIGIKNSRDSRIELLAPFLLHEISFYLGCCDSGNYDTFYSLEPEMEIIESIKKEKYPVFCRYLKMHQLCHIQLKTESLA